LAKTSPGEHNETMGRTKAGTTAAALAACLVLTAVASAAGGKSDPGPVELASMLLPRPALGAGAAGLPLTQDSGAVPNGKAAADANGHVTAAQLTELGRITGYSLDYGGAPAGGSGLSEAGSAVELYGTPAEARKGVAFWRKDELDLGYLRTVGFAISQRMSTAPGIGKPNFLESGIITLKGKAPLYSTTILFRLGRIVAGVSASASDAESAGRLALSLAHKLQARVRGVLSGKIAASASALRAKPKPGPPAGGPKLDALAMTAADLGGGKVTSQGYTLDTDLNPLSEYQRRFSPTGPFVIVSQQVALFRSTTQASFELEAIADIFGSRQAMEKDGSGSGAFSFYRPQAVAATGGDESRAVLAKARLSNGLMIYVGFVIVRVGATLEVISVGMPASDAHAKAELKAIATVASARARKGLNATPVA
jgi:hypothetical protein